MGGGPISLFEGKKSLFFGLHCTRARDYNLLAEDISERDFQTWVFSHVSDMNNKDCFPKPAETSAV